MEIKDEKVKKKFNQLKALQQSSKQPPLSDQELLVKARESLEKKGKVLDILDEIDIREYFLDDQEKKVGTDLLKKYIQDYVIETISDKNSLAQLIYLEVLNQRLQKALNDAQKATNGGVPTHLVETIHKNIKEITSLKSTLGIAKGKKEDQRDGFSYLQLIKKKYQIWLKENQASRYVCCPHCGKEVLWRIRPEAWELQKHPFFKDRILGNERLVQLYKDGKVNREDLAAIFGVSPFYIDWLVDKGWGLKIELKKEVKDSDSSAT